MRKVLKTAYLAIILILALIVFLPVLKETNALQTSGVLRIHGMVNRPLNLIYAGLLSFPMVSEVAELKRVDGLPDVTYNWTGIPLFYLLTLAQINPEAYKVVTYGSDGFSSDLLVEDALRPTTILALEARTLPGKVNPTQAEALIQICLQVIGNDVTMSLAEGFGSVLDLNVTKPLMIVNLLDSIELLANGINSFVRNCLNGIKANVDRINSQLEKNLMVITNLVPLIGYDKASEIAQRASRTGKTIRETILEMRLKIGGNLDELLDPRKML